MHDIEIPAQKQHAHNATPGGSIEQKCHYFSKHPAHQNWCFDYKNNNKMHKTTT